MTTTNPTCQGCGGHCCSFFLIPVADTDPDNLRWLIGHEGVSLDTSETDKDNVFLRMENRCSSLGSDGLCKDYENRPSVCKDYDPELEKCPDTPELRHLNPPISKWVDAERYLNQLQGRSTPMNISITANGYETKSSKANSGLNKAQRKGGKKGDNKAAMPLRSKLKTLREEKAKLQEQINKLQGKLEQMGFAS